MKRTIAVMLALALLLFAAAALSENATDALQELYAQAELLMVQEQYAEAAAAFDKLGPYSDASQMAMYCKALMSAETFGQYDMAVQAFKGLEDFRDSKQMAVYYTARGHQSTGDRIYGDLENGDDDLLDLAVDSYRDAEKKRGPCGGSVLLLCG